MARQGWSNVSEKKSVFIRLMKSMKILLKKGMIPMKDIKPVLSGQKYIFLDRDGTINKRPPRSEYVCKPESFVWLDGAMEAIKKLNDAGYFIIMISNQAGIARNVMTVDDFEAVQAKMKNDLQQIGAHIDAVYYCPHGGDDNCDCRKPKPGMLYQAQRDFGINLTDCMMIGDDERDIMAAHNADMRGILVTDEYTLLDAVNDVLNGMIKACGAVE